MKPAKPNRHELLRRHQLTFSYYASDANSSRADLWRQANPFPLHFSALNRLELRNALQLAVFQSRLTTKEADEIWATVESDLTNGLLSGEAVLPGNLMREAESLAANHTAQIGTRSLDVLHVAGAVLLDLDEFVTFDKRQAELAKQLGLKLAGI